MKEVLRYSLYAFHEKLLVTRCRSHANNIDGFLLPILEMHYIYNTFSFIANNSNSCELYETMIQRKMDALMSQKADTYETDEAYYYLLFYSAILGKYGTRIRDSRAIFKKIIEK